MAALNELLAYQKVDAELLKIEKEISASEEYKKYSQAKKFMKVAPEKLDAQDARAVELRRVAKELTARYKEIQETIADYSAVDEHVDDGGDVSYYKRSAQSLADSLRALKSELNKLVAEIEAACEEYKKMKAQTIAMQKQGQEYKQKLDELKGSYGAKVKEVNDQLSAIAQNIPPEYLEKYKAKRKEKIFPILVPLTNNSCMCGMDFAVVEQAKLSGGNVIECEHCRRFIYKQ